MKLAVIFFQFTLLFQYTTSSNDVNLLKQTSQDKVHSQAYKVLTTKCNVCHATKKRTTIFTLENMDSLALSINNQVFIKKKMPKGRKIKLTNEESDALRDWINSLLE